MSLLSDDEILSASQDHFAKIANVRDDGVEWDKWAKDFARAVEAAILAKLVPLTDAEISLMAHNEDDGDWNSLGYRGCWHRGYFAGARAIEAAHGIQAIDAAKGGQHEDA